MFQVPVLIISYNRLVSFKRVFNQVKTLKPSKLYISSDGPKNSNDLSIINEIRLYIMNNVDWECNLFTKFENTNLGCKINVSNSISWLFNTEEYGIILEDDTLPNISFFNFCETLLIKYLNNTEIYLISGENKNFNFKNLKESYTFSKYPLIYGWATWKRVWLQYRVNLYEYNASIDYKKNSLNKKYWVKIFDLLNQNKINTWDYQLTYLILFNSGLCIVPKENLVTNIGYGINSTNTYKKNIFSQLPNFKILEINKHPNLINFNIDFHEYLTKYYFTNSIFKKIVINIKNVFSNCTFRF